MIIVKFRYCENNGMQHCLKKICFLSVLFFAASVPKLWGEASLRSSESSEQKRVHVVRIGVTTGKTAKLIKDKMLISCGFIVKNNDIKSAVITGSKEEGVTVFAQGMKVLAKNKGIELVPGRMYTVFHYEKKVYHPESEKLLGFLVSILGEVKMLSSDRGIVEFDIVNSYRSITRGDRVMTLVKNKLPEKIQKRDRVSGTIISGYGERQSFASGDFMYIDLGNADGVIPGQIFDIYKKTYLGGDEENEPMEVKIGRFVAISVRNSFTSGFVYESNVPVEVGFMVR